MRLSLPEIVASCGASLANRHSMKPSDPAFQPFPYPPREVLAGRVLESINIIQVVMVELFTEGLECLGDLGVTSKSAEKTRQSSRSRLVPGRHDRFCAPRRQIKLSLNRHARLEDLWVDGEVEHRQVTPVRREKRFQHAAV